MFEIKTLNKTVNINNTELVVREGGFAENQPCVIVDDIASVHKHKLKYLNELIRNNIDMFSNDDIIDLMKEDKELAMELIKISNDKKGIKVGKRIDLFVFSEKGYIKLVSLMKNNKDKKLLMNEFIETYFIMKEHLTNISIMNPETFFDCLPNMAWNTCNKYFSQLVTVKNVDEIVPALINKFRTLKAHGSSSYLDSSKKIRLISCCANVIAKMRDRTDLKVYDLAKLDDYYIQLINYRHEVIKGSASGYKLKCQEAQEKLKTTKKELNDTKELLNKTLEEKTIIEKPVANEENMYEDLLRSFKVYRNFLAKVWDMGMEEVCNDYYDLIPVKLPMAKDCLKQGYQSKFEYCYAHYPDDTKSMVNKMYKDCVYNGYLERSKNIK